MIGWRVSITATITGCGALRRCPRRTTHDRSPARRSTSPPDSAAPVRSVLPLPRARRRQSARAELRLDVPAGALKALDDGWAVVKPGHPERSELVRRIFAEDDDMMPPSESHLSLTDAEKALLLRWVKEGADYRPHWAFLPVRSELPPKRAAGRREHQSDRLLHRHAARRRGTSPRTRGLARDVHSPRGVDADGLAPDPRRRSTPSSPTPRRRHSSASSIATWRRRRTASAWPWTGSTWRATPIPTATRRMSIATCRRIAIG